MEKRKLIAMVINLVFKGMRGSIGNWFLEVQYIFRVMAILPRVNRRTNFFNPAKRSRGSVGVF